MELSVKEIIKDLGLTNTEAAEKAAVSLSTIYMSVNKGKPVARTTRLLFEAWHKMFRFGIPWDPKDSQLDMDPNEERLLRSKIEELFIESTAARRIQQLREETARLEDLLRNKGRK